MFHFLSSIRSDMDIFRVNRGFYLKKNKRNFFLYLPSNQLKHFQNYKPNRFISPKKAPFCKFNEVCFKNFCTQLCFEGVKVWQNCIGAYFSEKWVVQGHTINDEYQAVFQLNNKATR